MTFGLWILYAAITAVALMDAKVAYDRRRWSNLANCLGLIVVVWIIWWVTS